MNSFVLHEQVAGAAPRRVCCDLAEPLVVDTLTCSDWQPIDGTGAGWSALGQVRVMQTNGHTVGVALNNVVPWRNGAVAGEKSEKARATIQKKNIYMCIAFQLLRLVGDFIGHVHAAACELGGGAHWQRVAAGPVDRSNELWAGGVIGGANDTLSDASGFIAGTLSGSMQSFVLHQRENGQLPKRCVLPLRVLWLAR